MGGKYPTKFSSQPSARPDYIPPNINLNGKQHKVFYKGGGYGYYAGSVWSPYSPFTDPFMAARLMGMSGYYYGPRPGLSFMAMFGMGIFLYLLFVVFRSFVASMGQGQNRFKTFR